MKSKDDGSCVEIALQVQILHPQVYVVMTLRRLNGSVHNSKYD